MCTKVLDVKMQHKFSYCLLASVVFRFCHVFRDALTLISRIELMQAGPALRVATFDVTALYQSIDLEWGPNSLRWFLNTFCHEYQDKTLQDLIMVLASFVLNYCGITIHSIS